jgi:arylsulfatase A-like enzyme/Tfp pilus assembly protein PilF
LRLGRKGKNKKAEATPLASASGTGRRRAWLAAVAVLLVTAGVVVRRLAPAPVRREPGLNVLLITIDTLRADALSCYGGQTIQTPWIDRLAREGVRFERVHAQNVVTLPSHANILSGRYPLEHGVRDNSGYRFPATIETLATILKRAGYRTGAFVSAFPLDSRFGLDRGFDVYDDRLGDPDARSAFLMPERAGALTLAAAEKWLAAQGEAKTFAWVHLYEPHFPYAPPEPFASRYAASPYHGEVAYADSLLASLLEPLLEQREAGRTLVVLTADHGEGLGEHGEKTHGIFAYESTLRVPLILYSPRLFSARLIATPVRHVDILPTILDALSLPPPPEVSGRSLLALASGHATSAATSYFEALSSEVNRGWAPLRGLIRDRYKLIDLPLPELFDLEADPHERKNLAASEPRLMDELRGQLQLLTAADRNQGARQAENAAARERLRSLGYLSAAAAPREQYTEDDDPKRLIGLDAEVQDVVTLFQAGDLPGALKRVKQLLAQRPQMPLALVHQAFLQHELGDLKAAVESLRVCVGAHPEDTDAVALLGAYLVEAGRPAEAAELLKSYAAEKDPDLDVLLARGTALAQAGRVPEGIKTFERALSIDPTNATAKANIGTAYLLVRDYGRARAALTDALATDPDVSKAHNALGVVAAESGHPDEAIDHWKRAVELNPREWDTVFNLGKLLRQRGREPEARPYLERFVREAPRALYGPDIQKLEPTLAR